MTPTNPAQDVRDRHAAISLETLRMIDPDGNYPTPSNTTNADAPVATALSEIESEILALQESRSQHSTPAAGTLSLDPVTNLRILSLAQATGADPETLLREFLHRSLTSAERKLNLSESAGENRARVHLFARDK